MAHEKEKAQYEEDRKNHERPWKLWENCQDGTTWTPCLCELAWNEWSKYRRIEPVFEPEYFSSLNWREALPLVGKVVEFSDDPDDGWIEGILEGIDLVSGSGSKFKLRTFWYEYIRTCPETHQHPTITIDGVKLPKPEVEAPEEGTLYWVWRPEQLCSPMWKKDSMDKNWLAAGMVHLTESRAQAWADWWDETVVREINRD